jgi:hypothetical protein
MNPSSKQVVNNMEFSPKKSNQNIYFRLEEMHQYYKFNKVKIRFYSSLYEKDVLQ